MTNKNFDNFCDLIFYNFKDRDLLKLSLTHPSSYNKKPTNLDKNTANKPNYERLEFLGDKVLSLIIGEYLMENFPSDDEGILSKRHSNLVAGVTLAKIATKIDLPRMIILGFGEKKNGGNKNKNNLENALEALIGAIYIDGGLLEARKFILHFWREFFELNIVPPQDSVSELQEMIQAKTHKLPKYFTEQKGGSDHSPDFVARVVIENISSEFFAEGKSKKEAQKNVAKIALEFLKSNNF